MSVAYTIDYDYAEQACYDADLDPERSIRAKYSGRAMYGDECFGLVHKTAGELLRFACSLFQSDPDSVDWLDEARQDSMGLDQITYWPRTQVENAPEEEDSPEEDY